MGRCPLPNLGVRVSEFPQLQAPATEGTENRGKSGFQRTQTHPQALTGGLCSLPRPFQQEKAQAKAHRKTDTCTQTSTDDEGSRANAREEGSCVVNTLGMGVFTLPSPISQRHLQHPWSLHGGSQRSCETRRCNQVT